MMGPLPEQPEPADGARFVRGACRGRAAVRWSPTANKGVIGIAMPPRSIEHVALADGACRDLPARAENTWGQWRR